MLTDILEDFNNKLVVANLCLFLALVFSKRIGFSVKQDILRTETALENLRREVEGLDLEISYLTNPERLKSIYVNIGSPDKHLMGKDEIKALDELIPFYHFQYEKTASSFTVR